MAINTIETASLFQQSLDKLAVQESLTSWMELNANQVIYNGGAEVKVPKMSLNGLADYDRDGGYTQGAVSLSYETLKMTQDRGRKFRLDAMDVNETNFVATASTVMGEFQRTMVVPEVDAYRISTLATKAVNKVDGYTPASATIVKSILTGISKVREVYNGQIYIHISPLAMLELKDAVSGKLQSITFSRNGIDTTVPSIDGCALIETPQNRMYTSIKMNDGTTTGQEVGGYEKGTNGKEINFLVCAGNSALAVAKQDKGKIVTPEVNQEADAWDVHYRKFHDCWVMDNKAVGLFVNTK